MKNIIISIAVALLIGIIFGGVAGYKMKSGSDEKKAMEYFVAGKGYFDAQQYPQASEMFNRSIGIKPEVESAHILLSSAYQKMGYADMAGKELEAGGVRTAQ